MGELYKIVRIFYEIDKDNEIIKTGLTLKEARKHCRNPNTSKKFKWFDGYEKESGE